MIVAKRTVSVVHEQGLHARPAALFVKLAKGFQSRITVKKGRKAKKYESKVMPMLSRPKQK